MATTFLPGKLQLSDIFPEPDVSVPRLYLSPSGIDINGYVGNEGRTEAWITLLFFRSYIKTKSFQKSVSVLIGRDWALSENQENIVVFKPTPGLLVLDPAIDDKHPIMVPINDKESLEEITESMLGSIHSITEELNLQIELEDRLLDSTMVDSLIHNVARDFFVQTPHVAVCGAPEMELVAGVPDPAWEAVQNKSISTAGVLANDQNGDVVVTTAHHGTGPIGTSITVNGHSTTIINANSILDVAVASYPDHAAESARFYKPLPVAMNTRQPVQFCGAASGTIATVIQGVDPAVPNTPRNNQVKIYTPNVLNFSDSGAALLTDDGYVVGFAFERTAADEPIQFSSWIWAKSVFKYAELN